MLRDPNLVPLSRQHHASLALCVRLARAASSGSFNLAYWQNEMQNHFELELRNHFEIEENVVFLIARDQPELAGLVNDLVAERVGLRDLLVQVGKNLLERRELLELGVCLAAHIRREEKQLFEGCQRFCSLQQMQSMGMEIVRLLGQSEIGNSACLLPPHIRRLT